MAQRHTTLERQKLYDEVWSIPITKVAESYNMSGTIAADGSASGTWKHPLTGASGSWPAKPQ